MLSIKVLCQHEIRDHVAFQIQPLTKEKFVLHQDLSYTDAYARHFKVSDDRSPTLSELPNCGLKKKKKVAPALSELVFRINVYVKGINSFYFIIY
jgi:hypothetical protein